MTPILIVAAHALAVLCFLGAAFIDSPWPTWPRAGDRSFGNWFCSLGWFFLALALLLQQLD